MTSFVRPQETEESKREEFSDCEHYTLFQHSGHESIHEFTRSDTNFSFFVIFL
jgi:hypothetical protein